ncbi:MAG: glutathione peroxidase [Deltaproteobacteria bacterium]|nr:glutathione peroxidase [Deltaproteobacteria bacterium]
MTVYDFSAKRLDGTDQSLADFKGQVLLIVNTASECGFTPQYEGLQTLHDELQARGFAVLGFPCNQFGGQEPGSDEQIASFCKLNYGVTFPMFSKIEVNGDGTHPLYVYLKNSQKGVLGSEGIKWNFTKFLIGKDGKTVKRYAPNAKPEEIKADIEKLLGAN